MRKLFDSKINLVMVASLFFLIILGCQPEGGELLPVGGEGIGITTSRFENDTAVINDSGLKVKLYGSWDGRAKVRVVIENTSGNNIKVDFKSAVLDSKGESINIDSFYEDKGDSINEIKDNKFSVGANEKHKLIIGFPLNFSSSLSAEPPRIISLVLAIEINPKIKESHEYKVEFRGIESEGNSGKADPKE